MEYHLNREAVKDEYSKLSSDQIEQFFPGEQLQLERVIGSLAYIIGSNIEYHKLVDLYLTIVSRILLFDFSNERIGITVKMRFSDIVSEDDMDSVIDCVRLLTDNYSYLYSLNSEEYRQSEQDFDNKYKNKLSKNAKLASNAIKKSGFGTDIDNPIYAHMPSGSFEYLNKLFTLDFVPVLWKRVGSVSSELSEDLIDRYNLLMPDGEFFFSIYINMYSKKTSKYCPKALSSYYLDELPEYSENDDCSSLDDDNNHENNDNQDNEYLTFLKKYGLETHNNSKSSIKALSKEELDEALRTLSKSKKDYSDPPAASAMCYSICLPWKSRVYYKCDLCGNTDSIVVDCYSDNDVNIINDYRELAKEFWDAGYEATISCYCKNCIAKDEKLEPIVFSFKTLGMQNPVLSYPNCSRYNDEKYMMALAFLEGKHTISEISEEFGFMKGEEYISCIKQVLGTEDDNNSSWATKNERGL